MPRTSVKHAAARSVRSDIALIEPIETVPVGRLAVTVEEGARMLGVGRATLYRLVLRGEIDSFTIGRARRIAVATLERYVGMRCGA
jgi:excisionase family DNA binding protein